MDRRKLVKATYDYINANGSVVERSLQISSGALLLALLSAVIGDIDVLVTSYKEFLGSCSSALKFAALSFVAATFATMSRIQTNIQGDNRPVSTEYGERFESGIWVFFITASMILLGAGGGHLVFGLRDLAGQ